MSEVEPTTCWTIIREAAGGSERHRSLFARNYLPLVRLYFERRWRGWPLGQEVDDAVQEVFVECCREAGPLDHADARRGGFRGFLLGVAANVARRFEERAGKRRECSPQESAFLQQQPAREATLSVYFDRQWAQRMMAEAAGLMEERAQAVGEAAQQRYRILRLRFEDGLPVRDIAERWSLPSRQVHDAYAQARREFYDCLRDTLQQHGSASGAALDAECRDLLGQLS